MGYRLGIDVGGTNTDAVIIDENREIIASIKTPTTEDVTVGIFNAVHLVLEQSRVSRKEIRYAMLGTTHCTNAIVERSGLLKVGMIRIGKPAAMAVMPRIDWPKDLKAAIGDHVYYVAGGHEFDGREIFPLDETALREACRSMREQVASVAITSIFAPVSADHEIRARHIVKQELGELPVTLSHEIASIGLLERENASILNAALHEVARATALGFKAGLEKEGVTEAAIYLCQNDGTLMSIDYSMQHPVLTIACGPTNSIRGACSLSHLDEAIVVDVGGTTCDIGVIVNSFPRESSLAVDISGVRTSFRMPDLISIGLGGGTVVRQEGDRVRLGPDSVGYRLTEEALVFGGETLTVTDVMVKLGMAKIGDRSLTDTISDVLAETVRMKIMEMISVAVDKMKVSKDEVPLVLVGGGSMAISDDIDGVSQVIRPAHYGVANAFGAAIAQVSGQIERVYALDKVSREDAMADARQAAMEEAANADAEVDSIQIVEVDEVPLAYLPGNATRIKVKAVGNLV